METKQFEFNGKQVIIRSKEDFSYGQVKASDLKEINETLYNEVLTKVEYFLNNEEKIKAEEEAKKKQTEFEKNLAINQTFLTELKPLLPSGYDFSAYSLDGFHRADNARKVDIKCGKSSVEVYYDRDVYSASAWSSHKTSKPWVVYSDCKRVRYSTLAKAVEAAVKKLEEMISIENARAEKEYTIETQENMMKNFAEENGFTFEKEYNHSNYRRDGTGYYTYKMVKDSITAKLSVYNDKVVITSYTVKKENITVEDLKREVQ